MFSDRAAKDIINSHKQTMKEQEEEEKREEEKREATTAFSTGIRIVSTVGQEIFADMIFLRILTKPRKYHVSEYDFKDWYTRKA